MNYFSIINTGIILLTTVFIDEMNDKNEGKFWYDSEIPLAFWLSVLDIVWMMVTFYGMRMLYNPNNDQSSAAAAATAVTRYNNPWSLGKNQVGGKAALVFILMTHLIASFSTTFNVILPANGCVVSLPLLTVVSVGIVGVAWSFLKKSFLPESQRQRIRQANHLD